MDQQLFRLPGALIGQGYIGLFVLKHRRRDVKVVVQFDFVFESAGNALDGDSR